MSWPKKRLSEVADYQLGKMLDQVKNRGESRPYLANKNVRWGTFDFSELREMRFEEAEFERFSLKDGDIVMCEGGEPGRCAIWRDDLPSMMFQKALHRIRPFEGMDSVFLYYNLSHRAQSGHLNGLFTGATIKHLPREKLGLVDVTVPDLPIQKRIASILSAYDDLINNNQRRIGLLEQAARLLFREWFVNFRFPGHETAKFVDGLPEGWKILTVEKSVERLPPGKLFSQQTASERGSVPILDQGKSGQLGFHDEQPSFAASLDDPVIVFANHTCYQRIIHFPFSAIQNVLPFKPSANVPNELYWLHRATSGLITLNAYKGHWPEFKIKELSVPTPSIAADYASHLRPMHIQMHKLEVLNTQLIRARDLLLPRLMDGRIPV